MQITFNTTNSGTSYIKVKKPIAFFDLPRFAFQKSQRIYFYSKKEIKDFMSKLPKDWLVSLFR